MYPELIIKCDDIQVHVKNGELLTVTVGKNKPFDFQYILQSYDEFKESVSYDDQEYYFNEWSKSSREFCDLLNIFKRYNSDDGHNPLLDFICCALNEKNAKELLSCIKDDFFKK